MKSFRIVTLGCKVNTYESEAMAELLESSGRYVQKDSHDADIFILNSCMVTEESEKKAAKILRRAKRENPEALICVTGCMSQINPDEAISFGADVVLGNTSRREILTALDDMLKGSDKKIIRVKKHGDEKFEVLAPKAYKNLTRANLKIEDGCDCYCSYCIIPYARGHVRSMEPEEIRREAESLVKAGHREIVLTGINIGMYGRDIGVNLVDAVKAAQHAGAERIRLGSLEIDLITKDIIKELAGIPELCPHFHTSLQSGSDTVLKRMNRHYTTAEYEELIDTIRANFKNPSVTTDVIVGFAGETDKEFRESMDFVKRVGFYKVHVFPYSRRSGTAGALMKNQVGIEEKKKRAKEMGLLADELFECFIKKQIGTRHNVLFETYEDGQNFGHTENYIYVKVPERDRLKNIIATVEITGCENGIAIGKVIE